MAIVEHGIVIVEHHVELRDHLGIAAQQPDQPGLILRREPALLPGVALGIIRSVVDRGRIKGVRNAPDENRAQLIALRIEAVAPIAGTRSNRSAIAERPIARAIRAIAQSS